MERPKIAIITLHPSNGGGVLSSLKVVYEYCKKYFEPMVFAISFDKKISASVKELTWKSKNQFFVFEGMNCFEIGARWAFWEPGHYLFTKSSWKDLLADYKYIFVTSGTAIAAHPAVLLEKKYVLWAATTHDADRATRIISLSWMRKIFEKITHQSMIAIERSCIKQASSLISLSTDTFNLFNTLYEPLKKNHFLAPYPKTVHIQKQSRFHNKVLLAVGRFDDPRKNLPMLLRVFHKIIKEDQTIQLIVCGSYDTTIASSFSHKNIHFVGKISNELLNTMYEQASLLLITSYQEGLGIVGIEAMSHAIPVIATECGGTQDYVINDVTGYTVPINDDEKMFKRISMILSNPDKYKELSTSCYNHIKTHFSHEVVYTIFSKALIHAYPELDILLNGAQGEYSKTALKNHERCLQ